MPNFTLGLVGRSVEQVMDIGNVVENIFWNWKRADADFFGV